MADKLTREKIEAIREAAGKATPDMVAAAAIQWGASKERGYSLADITYFENNWEALPGLREFVDRQREMAMFECDPQTIIALCDMALSPSPALTAAREALEPFANIAAEYSDLEDDDWLVWKDFDVLGASLPLRIFRRARAALALLNKEADHD